jgi:hypothetical protein
MSENTKNKLDSRLKVAFLFLRRFCEDNNTTLKRKFVETNKGNVVIICGADNGTHASLGIDEEGVMRIFMQDPKIMKWGLLEGFTEDEVYEKLDQDLIKEADLIQLARALVR